MAAGDALVTRQVKAGGAYSTVWQPRSKNRAHRRKLGLFAPADAIATARADAADTAERRAQQRAAGARQRDHAEDKYRAEFEDAIRAWLDFSPQYATLVDEIAAEAADRAVVVGSGRVGRAKTLTLDERAEMAGRAYIRHRFTDYDDHLDAIDSLDGAGDDLEYHEIRHDAHRAVDAFLLVHRQP